MKDAERVWVSRTVLLCLHFFAQPPDYGVLSCGVLLVSQRQLIKNVSACFDVS